MTGKTREEPKKFWSFRIMMKFYLFALMIIMSTSDVVASTMSSSSGSIESPKLNISEERSELSVKLANGVTVFRMLNGMFLTFPDHMLSKGFQTTMGPYSSLNIVLPDSRTEVYFKWPNVAFLCLLSRFSEVTRIELYNFVERGNFSDVCKKSVLEVVGDKAPASVSSS